MDPSQQRQQLSHPNQQQQQPVNGQTAYATLPFASAPPAVSVSSPTQPPPSAFAPHPYHQGQHLHSPQQQQQLQAFWANQMQEIEQTTDFKNHTLPLARIKKIMKADEDVKMISAEAPVIFAKACEMFILELTLRSWIHTEENKRRTLQKSDIAAAISRTDVFDFLVDIIPRDELKEEGLGITKGVAGVPFVGSPSDALPYYYAPPQAPMGVNGMMMGKPVDEGGLYANQQQPRPQMPFMPWSQAHAQHPSQQPPSRDPSSDS